MSTEPEAPTPSQWHGTPRPGVDRHARGRPPSNSAGRRRTIVDTRSDAERYGEEVRAKRGGAIPGSVHLEWKNNLTDDGRFKSREELAAMYDGGRHFTGPRGRSPTARAGTARRTRIWRCACWDFRACATTSARGRNGVIGKTCPSKRLPGRTPNPDEARAVFTCRWCRNCRFSLFFLRILHSPHPTCAKRST